MQVLSVVGSYPRLPALWTRALPSITSFDTNVLTIGAEEYDERRAGVALGAVIREHRKALGLSQERLAVVPGLDLTYVGGLLNEWLGLHRMEPWIGWRGLHRPGDYNVFPTPEPRPQLASREHENPVELPVRDRGLGLRAGPGVDERLRAGESLRHFHDPEPGFCRYGPEPFPPGPGDGIRLGFGTLLGRRIFGQRNEHFSYGLGVQLRPSGGAGAPCEKIRK